MPDMDIFEKQAFGKKLGIGHRAAVLVIDFQVGFTSDAKFGGYNINDAIANTVDLLAAAREVNMPVAHVRFIAQPGGFDIGPFGEKVPNLRELTADHPDSAFVASVAPIAGDTSPKNAMPRHSSAPRSRHGSFRTTSIRCSSRDAPPAVACAPRR